MVSGYLSVHRVPASPFHAEHDRGRSADTIGMLDAIRGCRKSDPQLLEEELEMAAVRSRCCMKA